MYEFWEWFSTKISYFYFILFLGPFVSSVTPYIYYIMYIYVYEADSVETFVFETQDCDCPPYIL